MNEIQQLESLLDELLRGIQDVLASGEILSDEFQGLIAQELESVTSRIDQLRAQEPIEPPTQEPEQETISTPPTPPINPLPPQGVPPLTPTPFPSSNINAFRYDPENGQLFVKFQGKFPAQNGPVYSYDKVPPFIFDVFRRGAVGPKTSGANQWHRWREGVTPSHGAAMAALIKQGGYAYRRMS